MAEKCPKCKTDHVVLGNRYMTTWDVDSEDIERLALEDHAEIETVAVWTFVRFCMNCDEIISAWVEEIEDAGLTG